MIKRLSDFLAGLPMTIAAGVFLLLDLIPHLMEEFGGTPTHLSFLPFDPAWVTIVISGIPLLYLAVWRMIHNPGISKISSALLICIAMFAAIAIGDLFAAGEVAFIMAIGALLEEATTNRAKKGLKKLISLAPAKARRLRDGIEETVPAEDIRQGDILRILPGETIPVDGRILSGETSVDQSVMTGESLPIDKGVGEEVFCGTINRFGSIDILATKVGEDSSLQKLIRMVQDAENRQAPMQRIADKAASWLVPVALLIAIFSYVFTGNIITAVTVLVVFCPCALVLATPTAVMAAIGQATKHGVIIKSGEALEKMGKVDTIAFDKTGTLTYGRLDVSDVISFDSSISETELLSLAASAESRSEHPLGKAIVACAKIKEVPLSETSSFKMTAGRGVFAATGSRSLLCPIFSLEKTVVPYPWNHHSPAFPAPGDHICLNLNSVNQLFCHRFDHPAGIVENILAGLAALAVLKISLESADLFLLENFKKLHIHIGCQDKTGLLAHDFLQIKVRLSWRRLPHKVDILAVISPLFFIAGETVIKSIQRRTEPIILPEHI